MARHLPGMAREALVDGEVGHVPPRIVVRVREIQPGAEDEGLLVDVRGAGGGHRGVAAEVELLVAEEHRVVRVSMKQNVVMNRSNERRGKNRNLTRVGTQNGTCPQDHVYHRYLLLYDVFLLHGQLWDHRSEVLRVENPYVPATISPAGLHHPPVSSVRSIISKIALRCTPSFLRPA